MKKGTKNFKLDDGWWKKEAHPEVVKAADKFGRALKNFSAADDSLNLTADDEQLSQSELAELNKATTLLADVEKEGREFSAKCQGHAKAAKDSKVAEAFTITGDVLKKALPKAIQEKREEYDSFDGDGDDAPLVTPDAHRAYLKKMLPRLKRMPLNFSFAVVSGEPTDQRFLFHKQKAARSLSTALKSDTNAKKITFGTAAAGHLISEERYGASALVLSLEGKPVPNLARRARLLFQKLGIATFNKIIVAQDGQELELSDDDEPDVALPPVEDDDDDDPNVEVGQGAPEPQPEAPPEPGVPPVPPAPDQAAKPKPEPKQKSPEEQRWLQMRGELGGLLERAVTVGHPPAKKARAVWGMAKGAAEKGDFGGAVKAATMVQALLKGFAPPPEDISERYARQSRKIVPLLTAHVKAGKPGGKAMRELLTRAEALAEKGQFPGALELLDTLARDLSRGGPDVEPVPEDRSGFARTLLIKSDLMRQAAEDLADVFQEPERGDFLQEVNQTLETARGALGDPNDAGAPRDFPAAFGAFKAVDRLLARARKAGKRTSATLTQLSGRIKELDAEVMALAPRVDDPGLVERFATAAQARQGVMQAMRRKDVFGAMARIGPWEEAVSALRNAAGAPQPETV